MLRIVADPQENTHTLIVRAAQRLCTWHCAMLSLPHLLLACWPVD